MTDRKKLEKYLIIGVIALFVVISATYAFFQAQLGDGVQTDVDIGSNTTDSLTFDVNNAINLNINQFNFGVGAGNLSSSATASATLLANNSSNTATYTYYVYFKINSNEFVYTTTEQKPEIVLTITNPNGEEVTSIEGLNYVTATNADGEQVKGFDITTATGAFAIASEYSITANSTTPTVQNWKFTATFINLDSDQQNNTGKEMDANIIAQQNELQMMSNFINNLYTEDGVNDLYRHDGSGVYVNSEYEAGDNAIRFSGADPNNYVCFGSEEESCSNDNLYRIIGVYGDKIKLIKATSIGTMAYNSNGTNDWNSSTLNNYLNNEFLDTINSGLISSNNWCLNAPTSTISKDIFMQECANESYSSDLYENYKIGLMYLSDYAYAALPECWNSSISSYNTIASGKNWLILGSYQWTIAPELNDASKAYAISGLGRLDNASVTGAYNIRPVLYLNNTAAYISGDGTNNSPFIIK